MYLEVGSWHTMDWQITTACLLILILDRIKLTFSASQAQVNEHLERGRDYLARGQLQEALLQYHAAVDGDPTNYLTLYKRGTVFLALRKARQAIQDLDKVLQLKPDFYTARLQRGNIFLKQAKFDEAAEDFQIVLQYDPNNVEAYDHYYKIGELAQDYHLVKNYPIDSDHAYVISILTKLIEVCPWSSELRGMRADRLTAVGDTGNAIADIRSTTKLESDNTDGYYRLSLLHYSMGDSAESLKEIRECLKLDPEHKDCFPHYKKVKKVDKLMTDMEKAVEAKEFGECVTAGKKLLLLETAVLSIQHRAHSKLCHCYLHDDQPALAIASCGKALGIVESPDTYCDRAEAHISQDMYDEAIRDYHKAMDMDDTFQRAREGIQRAQRLQKQSERRDYYKILGVSKSANKQQIIKAYRKMAQKWHPDKFEDEIEKKKAEKRFMDIAAAKEVLTDPDKRAKFDNGEDPLDPESGKYSSGGFPFNQGFHQFHGSPFQFKFHFS